MHEERQPGDPDSVVDPGGVPSTDQVAGLAPDPTDEIRAALCGSPGCRAHEAAARRVHSVLESNRRPNELHSGVYWVLTRGDGPLSIAEIQALRKLRLARPFEEHRRLIRRLAEDLFNARAALARTSLQLRSIREDLDAF